MKDNTNDNNRNPSLTEQLAFDKMDVPNMSTFGLAPPNPFFDGDAFHSTLTSTARAAPSSRSRAPMRGSPFHKSSSPDGEYLNRKQQ